MGIKIGGSPTLRPGAPVLDGQTPFRQPEFSLPFLNAFGENITFIESGLTVLGIIDSEITYVQRAGGLVATNITVLRIDEKLDHGTLFKYFDALYQVDGQQEAIDEQGLYRYVCSRRRTE